MKNPMNRRYLRELRDDFGKYVVLFLFMAGMIALVSGFLVSNDSMQASYEESFTKYNIEDGNFELSEEADETLLDTLEKEDLTIYKNYYLEEETKEVDSTLRIFINREKINKACLMEGAFPTEKNEIAIDRMYADNNELKVGDTITIQNQKMKITGLVALSDYSALFSNNSDMMFDAMKFGVAVVTEEGFAQFSEDNLHYSYSWFYDEKPEDDTEAKEMADDFMKVLSENAMMENRMLENYIPQYLNQAIHFTGDDMVGDNAMIAIFLYIVVLIIAFVMAITTSNTISKEANVIGTLRASGYSRGELVRHYMVLPLIVMFVAAVVGNILGYSAVKGYMASLYYGSYSLPTYVTCWNADAFIRTTIVPLVIMFVINFAVLTKKMRLSPLRFLRRDLATRKREKAFRLNTKIPIFTRFQLRVFFQNIPNYVVIFIGIMFANFILLFGFLFNPLLDKFSDEILAKMISDYQYVLKMPVETENTDAEKYIAGTLKTLEGSFKVEDVLIYGIEADSDYVTIDFKKDSDIYISSAYADKYGLEKGDTITLSQKYGEKEYDFTVDGIYDYPSSIAVFMTMDEYCDIFDKDEGYFNGYFSNTKLDDIEDKVVSTIITQDDLTKTSRQLKLSMGGQMAIFWVFGVVMFLSLIYPLSKIIIEKNSVSISMTKILGYNNGEINRLYMMSTTSAVLLSLLLTIPLDNCIMKGMCVSLFADYPGYFPYYVPGITYVKMLVLGVLSYAVVAVLQMKKIKKVPLGEALKNVE
ncbi:ABC transporter permease [Roseburia sp. 831b]|uniref:ABC transporter permease n=1 Tax=Roseburia sp. 831b TaxID=1261635 RepID=UPI000952C348|nr:FtsX-like permease family protein [Roseburia sp. 831b]WVK73283.1 FtsX-like permease family protein [Roseburia sp. 831b]